MASLHFGGSFVSESRGRQQMNLKRSINDFILNLKYAFRPQKPLLALRLVLAVLKSKCFGRVSLRYVDFAIDYACNLRCEHCFATSLHRSKMATMVVDDYHRVANECMDQGAVNFSFQGGEPLLCPDLGKFIAACSPHKNLISVTTNGTLLTPEKILELKKYKVDILTVSLDSAIPEEHDQFRGKEGTFNTALNGIELALKAGLNVTIGTVVTHQNLHSEGINGLITLAKDLKVILYLILPVPAGKWTDQKEMLLSDEDLNYINDVTQGTPYVRTDLQANLGGYGCGAAKEILYLTPYGDVLACPFLHVTPGNIFSDTVANIRKKAMKNRFFSKYHPSCLVSSDKEFVDKYLSKTFAHEQLPAKWDDVFESSGE